MDRRSNLKQPAAHIQGTRNTIAVAAKRPPEFPQQPILSNAGLSCAGIGEPKIG
jgi:hypothetical protein